MDPVLSHPSPVSDRVRGAEPARPTGLIGRAVRRLQEAYSRLGSERGAEPPPAFRLTLDDGTALPFGDGPPAFELTVRNRAGRAALVSGDETRVAEAFMAGDVDVEGDLLALLSLRGLLNDRHPLQALWSKFLHPLVFGQARSDRKWIAQHYDEEADFYLLFLDEPHRCYSHGLFEADDEPLDAAIRRKLDFALEAVDARPGQRVLDIGAGWGAMVEHGGRRGIRVTSLTISEPSERYVNGLIRDQNLPCRVVREHLLEYGGEPEPFDAIVNLGVTEHLPDYGATLARYRRLLKPGGRIYLDACSAPTKFPFSSFVYRYIFPGNATPMCLHDYLTEVAKTPFEVVAVHNDRHSYELTCRRWGENLERARDEIVARWGLALYRRFQLYLWGCVDVFRRGVFGAYRVILELPAHS